MKLEIQNHFNTVKQGDTKTEFKFQLLDFNDEPLDLTGKTLKVIIANATGKILEKTPVIDSTETGVISFKFLESDITGHGSMRLEVHVTDAAGETQIIPSSGYYKFVIDKNLNEMVGGVTSYTLAYFESQVEVKKQELQSQVDVVQSQVDQLVVEGDSSVEAAQARVKADGTSFTTLRDRLNNSDALLADNANKLSSIDSNGDGKVNASDKADGVRVLNADPSAPLDGEQWVLSNIKLPDFPVVLGDKKYFDNYYNNKADWFPVLKTYNKDSRDTIGWALKYQLEAINTIFEETKDIKYLNQLIDTVDKILLLRDDEVGRVSVGFNELINPIWSQGSRYGFGKTLFKNSSGENVIEVLTYGDWTEAGGATGLYKSNDDTRITIASGTNVDSFKITVVNNTRSFNKTYDNLSLNAGGIIFDDGAVRITVVKVDATSPTDNPAAVSNVLAGNTFNIGVVTNGMVCSNIMKTVQLILKHKKNNSYYMKKAREFFEKTKETVDWINSQTWFDLDSSKGFYKSHVNEPYEPNDTILPWNQGMEMVNALIYLYDITGEPSYKDKIDKTINYFLSTCTYDATNDLYTWEYWAWAGYTSTETTIYAILDYNFLYLAYEYGHLSETEIRRFTNTMSKNIFVNGGFTGNVAGTGSVTDLSYLGMILKMGKFIHGDFLRVKNSIESNIVNDHPRWIIAAAELVKYSLKFGIIQTVTGDTQLERSETNRLRFYSENKIHQI